MIRRVEGRLCSCRGNTGNDALRSSSSCRGWNRVAEIGYASGGGTGRDGRGERRDGGRDDKPAGRIARVATTALDRGARLGGDAQAAASMPSRCAREWEEETAGNFHGWWSRCSSGWRRTGRRVDAFQRHSGLGRGDGASGRVWSTSSAAEHSPAWSMAQVVSTGGGRGPPQGGVAQVAISVSSTAHHSVGWLLRARGHDAGQLFGCSGTVEGDGAPVGRTHCPCSHQRSRT
nr:hypothetical protein CFP56_56545 [Quercus suber]